MFQDQKMVGQIGLHQLKPVTILDYLDQTVLCGKSMAALQH
jgi:hypothetical protein